LGLDGSGAASDAASCRLVGAWLPIHRTGDSRAVRRFATSMASLAHRTHWGTVQDVVRHGGGEGIRALEPFAAESAGEGIRAS
jgi:hypothetical protein